MKKRINSILLQVKSDFQDDHVLSYCERVGVNVGKSEGSKNQAKEKKKTTTPLSNRIKEAETVENEIPKHPLAGLELL